MMHAERRRVNVRGEMHDLDESAVATLNASMADVASYAGVSPATVSRVANGSTLVAEETRVRVVRAMEKLSYRPNSAARSLKRGSFRSIGVVLANLATTGDSQILRGIVESAMPLGYTVTILTVGTATERSVASASARLHEAAVDAAIIVADSETVSTRSLRTLDREPLVLVSAQPSMEYWTVDTDQTSAARQAVAHLLDLGHETVHHVAGPARSLSAHRRMQAWRTELDEGGRTVPAAVYGDWGSDSGYEAGLVLAREPGVSAVFVANDDMALGLLRAFRERGVRVPDDVSLVGFDNIPGAENFSTPLTTVAQDFHEVGRRCVQHVVDQLTAGHACGEDLVPGTLVVRRSTAPRS